VHHARGDARIGPALGQRGERVPQRCAVVAGEHGPVRERGSGRGQRETEIVLGDLGMRVAVGGQPGGLRAQRIGRPARHGPQRRDVHHPVDGRRVRLGRWLLQDQVRVGAADAEGGHPGPP
jgi:hypothetical protein